MAKMALCYTTDRRRCVNTASQALSGPCSALAVAANVALPAHFNPVSGSGRACQGQQERCVNTPNPDTVLNTASESLGCNLGTATLAELCNDCATHELKSVLCLST